MIGASEAGRESIFGVIVLTVQWSKEKMER